MLNSYTMHLFQRHWVSLDGRDRRISEGNRRRRHFAPFPLIHSFLNQAQKIHLAGYLARPWLISDWALPLIENKVNFFIIEYTGTRMAAAWSGSGKQFPLLVCKAARGVQDSVHSGRGRIQVVRARLTSDVSGRDLISRLRQQHRQCVSFRTGRAVRVFYIHRSPVSRCFTSGSF